MKGKSYKTVSDARSAHAHAGNGNTEAFADKSTATATTINGMDGVLGVFFYNFSDNGNPVIMSNTVFIGQAGNDIVTLLYQVDVLYPAASDEGIAIVSSLDAFSQ